MVKGIKMSPQEYEEFTQYLNEANIQTDFTKDDVSNWLEFSHSNTQSNPKDGMLACELCGTEEHERDTQWYEGLNICLACRAGYSDEELDDLLKNEDEPPEENPKKKRKERYPFKKFFKNGKYIGKVNEALVQHFVHERLIIPFKAIPQTGKMFSWLTTMGYSYVQKDHRGQQWLCTSENQRDVPQIVTANDLAKLRAIRDSKTNAQERITYPPVNFERLRKMYDAKPSNQVVCYLETIFKGPKLRKYFKPILDTPVIIIAKDKKFIDDPEGADLGYVSYAEIPKWNFKKDKRVLSLKKPWLYVISMYHRSCFDDKTAIHLSNLNNFYYLTILHLMHEALHIMQKVEHLSYQKTSSKSAFKSVDEYRNLDVEKWVREKINELWWIDIPNAKPIALPGNPPKSNPPIYYHGTRKTFDTFKKSYNPREQVGFGIHFTGERGFANRYAYNEWTAGKGGKPIVYAAHLNIKNPLRANQIVFEGSNEFNLARKLAGTKLITVKDERGIPGTWLQRAIDQTSPQRAEKIIMDAGYDSVIYWAKIIGFEGCAPGQHNLIAEAESITVLDPALIQIISRE